MSEVCSAAVDPSRPLWLVKAATTCEAEAAATELPQILASRAAFQIDVTGRDQDRIRFAWYEELVMRAVSPPPFPMARLSSVI